MLLKERSKTPTCGGRVAHSPRNGRTGGQTDREGASGRAVPAQRESQCIPGAVPGRSLRSAGGPGGTRRDRALPPPGGAARERHTRPARIPHPASRRILGHPTPPSRPRRLGAAKGRRNIRTGRENSDRNDKARDRDSKQRAG